MGWDMQCRNLGKTGGMRWKVGESSMEGLEGGASLPPSSGDF